MTQNHPSQATAGILACDDGATIAYDRLLGKNPGIVFLHGFCSDRNGGKALHIEAFCRARGQAFLRLDVTGHGQSSGRFEDGTIGRWAKDVVLALDQLTRGPQILVGSSMGGWLGLLAALARPERIAGFLGLATAPDFTEQIHNALDEDQKAQLWDQGQTTIPNDDPAFPPIIISRNLISEAENRLLLKKPIPLHCPIRLFHGQQDESVPWSQALILAEKLESADIVVTLSKKSGHRLNTPEDLKQIENILEALIKQCETGMEDAPE